MLESDDAMFLAKAAAGLSFYNVAAHGLGHSDPSEAGLHLRAGQAIRKFGRRAGRQSSGNDQEHSGGFDHGHGGIRWWWRHRCEADGLDEDPASASGRKGS